MGCRYRQVGSDNPNFIFAQDVSIQRSRIHQEMSSPISEIPRVLKLKFQGQITSTAQATINQNQPERYSKKASESGPMG